MRLRTRLVTNRPISRSSRPGDPPYAGSGSSVLITSELPNLIKDTKLRRRSELLCTRMLYGRHRLCLWSHAERVRTANRTARVVSALTERMLTAAGIKRGMHVLDVGCGVGDVSFLLAGIVGIEGSITGVDLDGEAIKVADDRRAAQGLDNVAFHQSDARFLGPGQLFDAA